MINPSCVETHIFSDIPWFCASRVIRNNSVDYVEWTCSLDVPSKINEFIYLGHLGFKQCQRRIQMFYHTCWNKLSMTKNKYLGNYTYTQFNNFGPMGRHRSSSTLAQVIVCHYRVSMASIWVLSRKNNWYIYNQISIRIQIISYGLHSDLPRGILYYSSILYFRLVRLCQ